MTLKQCFARSGACALSFLAACGVAADGVEVDGLAQALDDAEIEMGLPAVGSFDQPGDCTGTLVDRNWVLTAGHCDKDTDPLIDFLIGVGPDRATMRAVRLDSVQFSQRGSYGTEVTLHRLAEPVDDVPVIGLYDGEPGVPWAQRVPVGETCTAVGYGLHHDEDGQVTKGTKRSRETVIARIDSEQPTSFHAGPEINGGDSGGPLLCGPDKTVVGVATTDSGRYATLDPEWIRYTIANGRPPEPPPTEPQFVPEQQLVRAEGELCPEGTMEFTGGALSPIGLASSEDTDGDGKVSCSIEISVLIPAGKQLESPQLCLDLYSFYPPPGAASLRYDFPGASFVDDDWILPLAEDTTKRCDTIAYASACNDPTQAQSISYSVEISVPVEASTGISQLFIESTFGEPDTRWNDCH
jgi:hypothetical protein